VLLRGGAVRRAIDEHIVLREVHQRSDVVWSFLLFSGYLKAVATYRSEFGLEVDLQVPNVEVAGALRRLFASFLDDGLHGADRAAELCRALLAGDALGFEALLGELLCNVLSYHDVAGRRPEAVYQAFVAGLLVRMDPTHVVSTNREAGFGRVDVLVSPREPGGVGVVVELKVLDTRRGETVEQALAAALRQLRERAYAAEVMARGAGVVRQMAAVFDGKRAWVAVAEAV